MLIVKRIQKYIKANQMDKKKQKFIDKIDEGFRYFDGFRLEELKEDDVYYIKAFMLYIEELESKKETLMRYIDKLENALMKARKQLKKANEILSS